MAVNWNILAQPQPEPVQFNPLAAIQAHRQGVADFRTDRKDNALIAAGQRMQAGDTKGAQSELYGAGEFDAGFKIGEHQFKQAQHELEVLTRAGRAADLADTPEKWAQVHRTLGLPQQYADFRTGRETARMLAYDKAALLQQELQRSQMALNRSHASLFDAQAAQAREKPAGIKLGEGETLFAPGTDGKLAPIAQGPAKNPPGFEPDPARPGYLRPKPGGPADDVKGEQAARVALLAQSKAMFPELRRIYLGDDKTPPSVGFPGVTTTPLAAAKHYGGFGDGGQGYRIVTTGTEAILRALTGAAAPEPEVKRVAEKYMPLPLDSKQTRAQKIQLFEEAVDLMGGLIAKGIVGADVQKAFRDGDITALRAQAAGQRNPQVPGTLTTAPPPVTSMPAPPPGFELVK